MINDDDDDDDDDKNCHSRHQYAIPAGQLGPLSDTGRAARPLEQYRQGS